MIQYRGETTELFMREELLTIKKEIENLFKEELKCNKDFVKIIPNEDLHINVLFNKLVKGSIYKKSIFRLSKEYNEQTRKYYIVGSVENFDITKNNIKKVSDRLRWILEVANKCLED